VEVIVGDNPGVTVGVGVTHSGYGVCAGVLVGVTNGVDVDVIVGVVVIVAVGVDV